MLFITAADPNAAIYKWIDDNGNVVYSGTRPPSGRKPLSSPSLPPAPRPVATTTLPFSTAGKTSSGTDSPPVTKQDEEIQKQISLIEEACEKLRNNLKILNLSDRIYEKDSQGVRTFLTETERKEKIRSTERRIREECPL
jgi:hypothetical protein